VIRGIVRTGINQHGPLAGGAISTPATLGTDAVPWHLALWDPFWLIGGAELSITLALNSARVEAFPRLIRERVARLSYRSIRGSPNCGKTLVSPNQVIVDIRSPSSVRTNNAYARAISACASGR
jgi:hypothetical protein